MGNQSRALVELLLYEQSVEKYYYIWWLVCAISLFRSFVFSPGVMARRQDEITPSEKTK